GVHQHGVTVVRPERAVVQHPAVPVLVQAVVVRHVLRRGVVAGREQHRPVTAAGLGHAVTVVTVPAVVPQGVAGVGEVLIHAASGAARPDLQRGGPGLTEHVGRVQALAAVGVHHVAAAPRGPGRAAFPGLAAFTGLAALAGLAAARLATLSGLAASRRGVGGQGLAAVLHIGQPVRGARALVTVGNDERILHVDLAVRVHDRENLRVRVAVALPAAAGVVLPAVGRTG